MRLLNSEPPHIINFFLQSWLPTFSAMKLIPLTTALFLACSGLAAAEPMEIKSGFLRLTGQLETLQAGTEED